MTTPSPAPDQSCPAKVVTPRDSSLVSGPVIVWTISNEADRSNFLSALQSSLVRDCLPWLEWEGNNLIARNIPTDLYAKFYFWSSGFGDGRFSADPTNS